MEEDESIGPWDTKLPSLTFDLRIKRRKKVLQTGRFSPLKPTKKPDVRHGCFVPSIHMDYFSMTFAPLKSSKSPQRRKVPSPDIHTKPAGAYTYRAASVMRNTKLQREVECGSPATKLCTKTLQQALTPINLALHLEPEYLQAGPKVLAGRFQHPPFVHTDSSDPALDALETRLTFLLQGRVHRRLMSQGCV